MMHYEAIYNSLDNLLEDQRLERLSAYLKPS